MDDFLHNFLLNLTELIQKPLRVDLTRCEQLPSGHSSWVDRIGRNGRGLAVYSVICGQNLVVHIKNKVVSCGDQSVLDKLGLAFDGHLSHGIVLVSVVLFHTSI